MPPPTQGYLMRRWRFGLWGTGSIVRALVLMGALATVCMLRSPTAYLPVGLASRGCMALPTMRSDWGATNLTARSMANIQSAHTP